MNTIKIIAIATAIAGCVAAGTVIYLMVIEPTQAPVVTDITPPAPVTVVAPTPPSPPALSKADVEAGDRVGHAANNRFFDLKSMRPSPGPHTNPF